MRAVDWCSFKERTGPRQSQFHMLVDLAVGCLFCRCHCPLVQADTCQGSSSQGHLSLGEKLELT